MSLQATFHILRLAITLTLLIFVCACASFPQNLQKPKVKLINIIPLNVSVSEQKLRFTLDLTNPNDVDLPVESIDFIARFNDTNIASGKSTQSTILPANGKASLSLDVTAGIDRLTSTLQTLLQGEQLNFNYELKGSVKIQNWAIPVPFNVTGVMNAQDGTKS